MYQNNKKQIAYTKVGATNVQLPTPEFDDEIMLLRPYRWQ
jgi:hypothetical protein